MATAEKGHASEARIIVCFFGAISVTPGSSVLLNVSSAPSDRTLRIRVFHSLDAAKCLLQFDTACPRCPRAVTLRIPQEWEAGMYSVVVLAEGPEGPSSLEHWHEWNGILVVKPGEIEAKSICGAQALPASQRPVEAPPPPRVDASASTAYSLCVVVSSLSNTSVTRYRLMQRLERGERAPEAETGTSLGCLPNGEPAGAFREVALFKVSREKGARKEYEKIVPHLKPGRSYSFLTIAEAEHTSQCSEEVVLCCHATFPAQPAPPQLARREKNLLKVKWVPPDDCGSAIERYQVCMALAAARALDTPFDHDDAEAMFSGSNGRGSMGMLNMDLCYEGQDTAHTFRALQPGARHVVRVRACNAEGWSDWSRLSELCTACGIPDAPPAPCVEMASQQNLTQKSARLELRIEWQEPAADNGAAVTAYVLEHDDGDGFKSAYRGPKRVFETKVAPASHHRFRARAVNAVGSSQPSEPTIFSSPALPPPSPLRPSALSKQKGKSKDVVLKWQAPLEDNGSPVTHFRVFALDLSLHERGVPAHELGDGAPGTAKESPREVVSAGPGCAAVEEEGRWVCLQEVLASTVIPAVGPQLVLEVGSGGGALFPGTEYLLRVTAVSSVGESPPSDDVRVETAPAPPPAPAAPRIQICLSSQERGSDCHVAQATPSFAAGSRKRFLGEGFVAVEASWEPVRPHQVLGKLEYCLEMLQLPSARDPVNDRPLADSHSQEENWSQVYKGSETQAIVQGLRANAKLVWRLSASNTQGSSIASPSVIFLTPAKVSPVTAPAPPPAAPNASKNTSRGKTAQKPCKFGAACTFASCKFLHPAQHTLGSAAIPLGAPGAQQKAHERRGHRSTAAPSSALPAHHVPAVPNTATPSGGFGVIQPGVTTLAQLEQQMFTAASGGGHAGRGGSGQGRGGAKIRVHVAGGRGQRGARALGNRGSEQLC